MKFLDYVLILERGDVGSLVLLICYYVLKVGVVEFIFFIKIKVFVFIKKKIELIKIVRIKL